MATAQLPLPALPKDTDEQEFSEVIRKYRAHVVAQRIRLREIFQDFDPLRSGLMTVSRFKRCISASMDKGIVSPLTEAEIAMLTSPYKLKDMVYWRHFVDYIDQVSNTKPTNESQNAHSAPFRRPLSPESEESVKEVIATLKSYVKHHGSDVKSWFTDFDKYKNGYVTFNQFRRGIPQNLLGMDEEELLIARYGEKVTGTVNYFKLNTDVNRKPPKPVNHENQLAKLTLNENHDDHLPVGTEELLLSNKHQKGTIADIEERIQKFVYKNRIRIIECWRDYDRHNFGHVAKSQFLAGLRLLQAPLEAGEEEILCSKYALPDGRIHYRNFCVNVDTIFTVNHLESSPLSTVAPPAREWLSHNHNHLSKEDESRLEKLIEHLKNIVKTRRLLLVPFFKDFDKSLGNMGLVTRSHFSRIMSIMGLEVSDNDLHLLLRKYEDTTQGKVDYMEFIKTIDPETYSSYSKPKESKSAYAQEQKKSVENHSSTKHNTDAIIQRIQNYVRINRIRISEMFRDHDKLRKYSIRKMDFWRALGTIGYTLSEEEKGHLCEFYADKSRAGFCRWKDFNNDIERVFGETNLESKPGYVHNEEQHKTPFLLDYVLTDEENEFLQATLQKIGAQIRFLQISCKPFFRDFDKICSSIGHVTKAQFQQCLTFMKCSVTKEEFEILCKKYASQLSPKGTNITDAKTAVSYIEDVGTCICYLRFLEDLEVAMTPKEPVSQPSKLKERNLNKQAVNASIDKAFEKLMMKIKIKVKTERLRFLDFLSDFDHLRHGKISKNDFKRAIKVVFADLTEPDMQILVSKFAAPNDPGYVDYTTFANEIESVFTRNEFEKNPLEGPVTFDHYSNGWEADPFEPVLTEQEASVLQSVMTRLHAKVNSRRVDALHYMEDYDTIREGTITVNQFRSVLNSMNLSITDKEMEVIAKYFGTNEFRTRVNYRKLAAYQG